VQLHRWLEGHVTVRSLRGGIIQFESTLEDPDLARDIVEAYSVATRERLAQIARRQTEYKRDVLVRLVSDASARLARAKGAYDTFRLRNELVIPELALQNESAQIPMLEGAIRSKQIELQTARQFNTDQNIAVQQLLAQLSGLQQQLAAARATSPNSRNSLGSAVTASRRGEQLLRDVQIAQSLYDNYMKFLEGTSVEDMTSTASVRVLEPPYIDTARQVNWTFLALAMALGLLWIAIEFYRLRPAVGERIVVRDTYA
jgi:tyrosine-protein kinase Etk/Wzc